MCTHTHTHTWNTSFLRIAELFSSLQVPPSIVQGCATRWSPVNGEWVTPQRTPRTSHEYTLHSEIAHPCINRLVTPSGSRTDDVSSPLQIWPPLYCAHLLGQQLSGCSVQASSPEDLPSKRSKCPPCSLSFPIKGDCQRALQISITAKACWLASTAWQLLKKCVFKRFSKGEKKISSPPHTNCLHNSVTFYEPSLYKHHFPG